jgi:toxin ParE1/3/4
MPYRLTRRADDDILDIFVWGHQRLGLAQAERYHHGLRQTFELIAEHPQIARERQEFVPPVRLLPHRSHLVIYTLQGDDVLILRVLHGAQEWERYL